MGRILVWMCICNLSAVAAANDLGPAGAEPASQARFWHLALVVRDLDRMHDFYTRVLGLKRVTDLAFSDPHSVETQPPYQPLKGLDGLMGMERTRVEIRHYTDSSSGNFLELMRYPEHRAESGDQHMYTPAGWNHLGLQVSDLGRILRIMNRENPASIVGGPAILNEFGGNKFLIVKDPEGNLLELYEPAEQPASTP